MESSPVVLTLTLNNSQPIALDAFVKAFIALAEEYRQAVRENDDFSSADAQIFIKEIRAGSIVADLIPIAQTVLPLVATEAEKIGLAVDFVNKWKDRLSKLANGIIPEGSSRSDLKRWADAVKNIARDPDASSTLEAATFEDGERKVRASLTFSTPEARKVSEVIEGEYKQLYERALADHQRVLMVFTRPDSGDAKVGKKCGERVLIQEIHSKPLAITYGSELAEQRIKHEIRESDENIFKKGFYGRR